MKKIIDKIRSWIIKFLNIPAYYIGADVSPVDNSSIIIVKVFPNGHISVIADYTRESYKKPIWNYCEK